MKRQIFSLLIVGLLAATACAPTDESAAPYDPEEEDVGAIGQAVVPSPPAGTVLACGTTSECNNLGTAARPPCSSLKWNVCRDSFCIWQVDSTQSQCKCVPGSMRRCTPTGISTCNAQGTGWGTCQ